MLCDVEEGDNMMLTRLTLVATLIFTQDKTSVRISYSIEYKKGLMEESQGKNLFDIPK